MAPPVPALLAGSAFIVFRTTSLFTFTITTHFIQTASGDALALEANLAQIGVAVGVCFATKILAVAVAANLFSHAPAGTMTSAVL